MPAVYFTDEADILDMRYDIAFKAVSAQNNPKARKALSGPIKQCTVYKWQCTNKRNCNG